MSSRQKRQKRIRRHKRVRAKIFGTAERPRLSVFRSSKHIHLQIIDDAAGKTLAAVSTLEVKDTKGKLDRASAAAKVLADKVKTAGIKTLVFDRGGYKFHGRVAAVAASLREAGLKI